eukprot:14761-Pelagomonas_calceolata.AAC.3
MHPRTALFARVRARDSSTKLKVWCFWRARVASSARTCATIMRRTLAMRSSEAKNMCSVRHRPMPSAPNLRACGHTGILGIVRITVADMQRSLKQLENENRVSGRFALFVPSQPETGALKFTPLEEEGSVREPGTWFLLYGAWAAWYDSMA